MAASSSVAGLRVGEEEPVLGSGETQELIITDAGQHPPPPGFRLRLSSVLGFDSERFCSGPVRGDTCWAPVVSLNLHV